MSNVFHQVYSVFRTLLWELSHSWKNSHRLSLWKYIVNSVRALICLCSVQDGSNIAKSFTSFLGHHLHLAHFGQSCVNYLVRVVANAAVIFVVIFVVAIFWVSTHCWEQTWRLVSQHLHATLRAEEYIVPLLRLLRFRSIKSFYLHWLEVCTSKGSHFGRLFRPLAVDRGAYWVLSRDRKTSSSSSSLRAIFFARAMIRDPFCEHSNVSLVLQSV